MSHVRPEIGELSFNSLSYMEGANHLIKPFIIEEIKEALWDCNNFKFLGLDNINLCFIKYF